MEDDLLLSPDFLTLFVSAAWLLKADPSLWCVSAWNDQGFPHTTRDPSRLRRTDYFPGLGWMISAELWNSELRATWPEAPTTGWALPTLFRLPNLAGGAHGRCGS